MKYYNTFYFKYVSVVTKNAIASFYGNKTVHRHVF